MGGHSVFQDLLESYQSGELLLYEGGFCQFRQSRRTPGVVSIYLILSTIPGVGRKMLQEVIERTQAREVHAWCPEDLPANGWYQKMGFILREYKYSRTGRKVNHWVLYPDETNHREEDDMYITVMKWLRRKRGWTLQDLQKASGVNSAQLSLIERGRLVPTPRAQKAIAQALGVPEEDLLKDATEYQARMQQTPKQLSLWEE